MYKCKKKDCKYRAPEQSVNTCDYRLITGHGRGCPIEDCTLYAPGEREKVNRTTTGIIRPPQETIGVPHSLSRAAETVPWTKLNEPKERKEPKPMVTLENTERKLTGAETSAVVIDERLTAPAKRGRNSEQTAVITNALIDGMTVNKICDTYGFKKQAVYDVQSRLRKNGTLSPKARKQAESDPPKKRAYTRKQKPEPAQSVATPSDEQKSETAIVMQLQGENYMTKSELFTELTYMRVNKVMESVVSGDNPKVKAAALTMVRELRDQSEKRSEVRE